MGRPKEVTDEQIIETARRCFLSRGAGISTSDIARELGVSHTTLFNRFGSKESLLLAALGPPKEVPWVLALKNGPDERPIREQLVEHAKVIAVYFEDLQAGLSLLQAAGVDISKAYRGRKGDSAPAQAFRALGEWLERAQRKRRIAKCDVDILSALILGALQSRAFAARLSGEPVTAGATDRHVQKIIELLWTGIGIEKA
jgi:AcrR family transcriptional regulator